MINEQSASADRAERVEALFDEGMERWWAGDRSTALYIFRRVLRMDPKHADAHNHIGIASLDIGRPVVAERHFRAAIEAGAGRVVREGGQVKWSFVENRPYLRGMGNLAIALRAQRRYAAALLVHQDLLRLNPTDNQGVRYLIGEEMLRTGDIQGAIRAYRATCAEEPGSAYGLALARLHALGPKVDIGEALLLGFASNRYVPPMLLGERWERLDGWHGTSTAEPEWAAAIVEDQADLWRGVRGGLDVLRWWWTAIPVRTWRAKLDAVAVELKDLSPSPERGAVCDRQGELQSAATIREVVRAAQRLS